MTWLATLTLFSAAWTRSWAEPPAADAEDLRRVKLAAGEKAPFAGVLLTPAALAKTLAELEARAARLRVELEAAKKEAAARADAARKTADAALAAEREKRAALEADLLRRSALYERSLERLSSSEPWYKSGYLTMGLGLLLGGGICAGTAAAVSR